MKEVAVAACDTGTVVLVAERASTHMSATSTRGSLLTNVNYRGGKLALHIKLHENHKEQTIP